MAMDMLDHTFAFSTPALPGFYGDYKGPNYTLSADRSYMVLLGNLIQPSLYPGFGGGWYNIDFADLGGGLLSWTGMAGSFSNPVTASGTGRFALSSSAIQAVPDSGGSLPLLVIALAACVVLPRWVLSRV